MSPTNTPVREESLPNIETFEDLSEQDLRDRVRLEPGIEIDGQDIEVQGANNNLEILDKEAEENPEESATGVITSIRSKFKNFFSKKEKDPETIIGINGEDIEVEPSNNNVEVIDEPEAVNNNVEILGEEDTPKGIISKTKQKFRNFFANMAERVGPSMDPRLNELKEKENLSPIEEREMTIRQRLATIRPFALAFAITPIGIPTFGLRTLAAVLAYGMYHGVSIASIKAMQAREAISNRVSNVVGRNTEQELLAA